MTKPYVEEDDSTFTHCGNKYNLNSLLLLTQNNEVIEFPISDLKWVLKFTKIDPKRVLTANLDVPILVVDEPRYGLVTVDGAHRLFKAVKQSKTHIKGRLVSEEQLLKALINKGAGSSNLSKSW